MHGSRFDALTRGLAQRLSRRSLVGGAATALTAGTAVTAGGRAAAQSTPAATLVSDPVDDIPEDTAFLFVQTAASGTWEQEPGNGAYTLTLHGISPQTVYFSDRPERFYGSVPMQEFLDGLGFTPDNPPNAAIVAGRDADAQEVLVLELSAPVYDPDAATLTYQAVPLDVYEGEQLVHLSGRQQRSELPVSFDHASLFIDDCPSASFTCTTPNAWIGCVSPGTINEGTCWKWWAGCIPCRDYAPICNQLYPDFCKGECIVKSQDEVRRECLGR